MKSVITDIFGIWKITFFVSQIFETGALCRPGRKQRAGLYAVFFEMIDDLIPREPGAFMHYDGKGVRPYPLVTLFPDSYKIRAEPLDFAQTYRRFQLVHLARITDPLKDEPDITVSPALEPLRTISGRYVQDTFFALTSPAVGSQGP